MLLRNFFLMILFTSSSAFAVHTPMVTSTITVGNHPHSYGGGFSGHPGNVGGSGSLGPGGQNAPRPREVHPGILSEFARRERITAATKLKHAQKHLTIAEQESAEEKRLTDAHREELAVVMAESSRIVYDPSSENSRLGRLSMADRLQVMKDEAKAQRAKQAHLAKPVQQGTRAQDSMLDETLPIAGPTDQQRPQEDEPFEDHQCFVAGTSVLTPDAAMPLKPIESLVSGDEVWTCDTKEEKCVIRKIVNTTATITDQLLLIHTITPAGTEVTLETTPNHPFYKVDQKNLIYASDLHNGDALWGFQDTPLVTDIQWRVLESPVTVFNIQVDALEGGNNYFVGEHFVLVHNCKINETVNAVATVAGPTCAVTAAACGAGLAATAMTSAMIVPSGGAAGVLVPQVVGTITGTCQAAAAACSTVIGAKAITNALATKANLDAEKAPLRPANRGNQDSAGQNPGQKMLGENGTQVSSKTTWKGQGKERIDVENPNPGKRPGQVHHQDNEGNKYLYDPKTDSFIGAPRKVNDLLNRPDFRNGIKKAMKYLGEQ